MAREIKPIDTELFIEEVEKRVAILDMESSDYSMRNLKRRGWEELVEFFSNPGDSDEKKKALGTSLQKKWKGLRDCFVRELKKISKTPSGSGSSNKNPYIYFNRLMFLERSVRNKLTEGNLKRKTPESTVAKETDGLGEREDVMRPPNYQQMKKKKISAADSEFLGIIKSTITPGIPQNCSTTEYDDDKHFCLSLHIELLRVGPRS